MDAEAKSGFQNNSLVHKSFNHADFGNVIQTICSSYNQYSFTQISMIQDLVSDFEIYS